MNDLFSILLVSFNETEKNYVLRLYVYLAEIFTSLHFSFSSSKSFILQKIMFFIIFYFVHVSFPDLAGLPYIS